MINRHDPTWRAVAREVEARIASARDRIEASGLSIEQTENERGYLRALREILALAEKPPEMPSQNPRYD